MHLFFCEKQMVVFDHHTAQHILHHAKLKQKKRFLLPTTYGTDLRNPFMVKQFQTFTDKIETVFFNTFGNIT